MKAIVVLEMDENMLRVDAKTGEKLIGLLGPGVTLVKHLNAKSASEYEYTAFAFNKDLGEYEQMGRPVGSELLAKKRFYEYAERGWFHPRYDISKVVFKRRMVSEFYGEWEAFGNEE